VAALTGCPGSRPWRLKGMIEVRACVGPMGAKVRRVSGPHCQSPHTALSREYVAYQLQSSINSLYTNSAVFCMNSQAYQLCCSESGFTYSLHKKHHRLCHSTMSTRSAFFITSAFHVPRINLYPATRIIALRLGESH
jgi:hypothetical protein